MASSSHLFSTLPVIRHSFATPLTTIVANAEIAAETMKYQGANASPALYMQRVLSSAQYLQSALMLADTDTLHAFSPKSALFELFKLNEGTHLHSHLVSRIFIPENCHIAGNKLSFQEVTACLLNNAYESYLPHQKRRYVYLSASANSNSLTLSIVDGGKGMGWFSQKLSTLPFYSTKKSHSGLGLHYAKRTVHGEFNGKFILRSRRGKGTTIIARFPIQWDQPISKPPTRLNY